MSMIRTLTPENFGVEMKNVEGLAVLDYWAPWCAPCRALLPALEELAAEFAGRAVFLKLNVDDDPRRAVEDGVRGVPTLVFLKDGEEVDRVVGVESQADLRRRIEAHI